MSPEQAAGDLDRLGPRSDVYSLGATLYCLLTGKPPFEGDAIDVIPRRAAGRVPPPRASSIPSIDRALEADLPEGDGPRAGGPLRDAPGAGRRRRALDGRRAGHGLSRDRLDRTLTRWLSKHRTWVTLSGGLLVALAGLVAVLGVQTAIGR